MRPVRLMSESRDALVSYRYSLDKPAFGPAPGIRRKGNTFPVLTADSRFVFFPKEVYPHALGPCAFDSSRERAGIQWQTRAQTVRARAFSTNIYVLPRAVFGLNHEPYGC